MNRVEKVTIYITHGLSGPAKEAENIAYDVGVDLYERGVSDGSKGAGVVYSESEWASKAEVHELKRSGHLSLFGNQSVRAVEGGE